MTFEHRKITEILNRFEQLSQIPRCSRNEKAIRDWLIKWTEKNQFQHKVDEAGNLLIKIPASIGYENSPVVILQGHLDMVCEKTPDSKHDFTKDPLKLVYAGEWLTADKTSLGADNGISIALTMVLVLDDMLVHPPLELLFTVDEESGLIGAEQLEADFFTGRILINIDSEDEGNFTIGCAGGIDTHFSMPLRWTNDIEGQLVKIKTGGMRGGHSGININTERANAIKVLARIVQVLKQQLPIKLVNFKGGTAHNAIPRDAEALLFIPADKFETTQTIVQQVEKIIQAEYKDTESNLFIKANLSDDKPKQSISSDNTQKLLDSIFICPHGVLGMSIDMKNLVESSTNLAKVEIKNQTFNLMTSQRSSVESKLDNLIEQMEALARLIGADIYTNNRYPAWQPNLKSPLLNQAITTYKKLFDKSPKIEALHAGLECGTIGNKVPSMDMLSIGPNIKYPHSPDEKINIASIAKIYDLLAALLKELK